MREALHAQKMMSERKKKDIGGVFKKIKHVIEGVTNLNG
jgi:hypothetical protein